MKKWFLSLTILAGMLVGLSQTADTVYAHETESLLITPEEKVVIVDDIRYYGAYSEVMSIEDAVAHIKAGILERAETITVTITKENHNRYDGAGLMDLAMAHQQNGKSYEGDAMKYDGNYSLSTVTTDDGTYVKITYNMEYRTTLEQEQALQEEITRVVSSLGLEGKTDRKKVDLIYQYICDNVDYDRGATYGELTYTSYCALMNKKAVCQGYAVLFYRMCMEAGIDARIISGAGNGGAHAWNIVKVGDSYFNVDTTWDGQDETSYKNYYLKADKDFGDHEPEDVFLTEEFKSAYPMSEASYFDYATLANLWNLTNIAQKEYPAVDGGTVTNTAGTKAKLLIYYGLDCQASRTMLRTLAASSDFGVDIVAFSTDSEDSWETISNYVTSIGGGGDIRFAYNTNGAAYNGYLDYHELLSDDSSSIPYLVYIDENNKVRSYHVGTELLGTIRELFLLFKEDAAALTKTSLDITVGSTEKLEVTIGGEKRPQQAFDWVSSDENIAIVDGNGVVKGIAEGTATISCSAGNAIQLQAVVEVAKHVHLLDEGTVEKAATCTEKGMKVYRCTLCDTYSETEEIPMVPHKEVVDEAVPSTCLVMGKTEGSHCENCDLIIKKQTDVALAEHVENAGKITKEASCKETGIRTFSCKWCDKVLRTETLEQLEHEVVTDEAIEPTYTSYGKTEGSHCKQCGEILVKQNVVPAKEGLAMDEKGDWYYYREAKVDTTYSSLVKYAGSWWYVVNGKLDFSYTGLAQYGGSWWYIADGKLDFGYTGLAQYGGSWWYIENGKLNFSYTGLAKYNGSWWYMVNGKLDFGYTGLAKYNGNWWYIKSGRLDFSYSGLSQYGGSWWYMRNGMLDFGYTGLASYGGHWWYMRNGKLDFGYTGLSLYNGSWWYIKNGKLDFDYSGLAKHSGSWWYIKSGRVDFGFSGLCQYNGSWWYMEKGKLNFGYTGLAWYGSNWWYIKEGKLNFNYTGTVRHAGYNWYVEKGIMQHMA